MTNEHHHRPHMTVRGEGSITAEPDLAEVELGVVTENENVTTAQQENAVIMHQILQSLLSFGVGEGQIQTSDYSIYPKYDYEDGKQILRGYVVTHMIRIRVPDISMIGSLIDSAAANGANKIAGIQFTLRNPDTYEQQALSSAVDDALVKARTIASTIQVQLVPKPVQILETSTQGPRPRTMMKAESFSASSTPVQPGKLEITASVEAKFEYIR
ncbi:SIMPL domain-containing protein [Halobacillus salinarum]|uniref:SIMPL domain-containing protein n=1 Tax=Halobacillus salinarum TaxID=2932257 RepID=A0ABY4EG60_9BACI|nr:SIMPL domain-containing protein [Halobacillus salinarum]UOQ42980.1 SIMPL domain-containing protein [Halobacillus salinarum]